MLPATVVLGAGACPIGLEVNTGCWGRHGYVTLCPTRSREKFGACALQRKNPPDNAAEDDVFERDCA